MTARPSTRAGILTTSSIMSASRASGRCPLGRGEFEDEWGVGTPNPNQLEKYIENGCFAVHEIPQDQRYYRHVNKAYIDWAVKVGYRITDKPVFFQIYLEPMQKFRLAARGHGSVTPPAEHRDRIRTYFDPLPFWYPPF